MVLVPFRSLLHMPDETEKLRALEAARELLQPGGRLVFDGFTPSAHDIAETNGIWLAREPGRFEPTRTLVLSVRGSDQAATMELHWLSAPEWQTLIERAGFDVEALYGWFDRRPWQGGEDQIWVCRAPGSAATL